MHPNTHSFKEYTIDVSKLKEIKNADKLEIKAIKLETALDCCFIYIKGTQTISKNWKIK